MEKHKGGSMTQYKSEVEQQAILLELEAWAKETKSYHFHNLSNLWYDDDHKIQKMANMLQIPFIIMG